MPTWQVAAACLYIACRQNSKAYLLIDFSDHLRINVYVLGVFLLLCQRLRLEEHPIVQKPIDPSLFIHRFTERLLGEKNFAISRTAMRIIASMKRDWMQTGRKPSRLCGAAIYISALSHGLKYSKSDINEKEVGSSSTAKLSKETCSTATQDEIENESMVSRDPENLGTTAGHPSVDEAFNQSHEHQDTDGVAGDESESLSDVDDVEVNGYLHNEEEARYKKIIWEEMNKEYLEEQAAKEAAAAAAKEAYEANLKNCSEDVLAYQELVAAAAAKSRKVVAWMSVMPNLVVMSLNLVLSTALVSTSASWSSEATRGVQNYCDHVVVIWEISVGGLFGRVGYLLRRVLRYAICWRLWREHSNRIF